METVGEKLKKARIKRGLTIDDLERITKIQRRYLEAIEKNNFDAISNDYYKKTFIRQFADAVGVNPRPLLTSLEKGTIHSNTSNKTSSSVTMRESRKKKYNAKSINKKNSTSYVPITLLALSVVVIIGTIIWAIVIDSENGPIVPKPNGTTVASAGNSQKQESSTDTSTESSKTEETTSSTQEEKKNNFTLVSDDGSVILYQVDTLEKPTKVTFKGVNGAAWVAMQSPTTLELVYQYTLQANEEVETVVPDDLDNFNISLGAPPNTSITVNGEELKFNEKSTTQEPKTIVIEQKSTTTQSSSTNKEDAN